MARANLAPTLVSRAGVKQISVVGTNQGAKLGPNDGSLFIKVNNSHATLARVVTIETPGTVDSQAIADRTVSVPALDYKIIGPFPPALYNQNDGSADNDFVYLDYPVGQESDVNTEVYTLA